jgi:CheY-like chemotaxis protein
MTPGPTGALLVVDDDEANRTMLARRLMRLGHQVTLAANGRLALEQLRARPFDLLLLDIQMPEMNGYETARRIRNEPAGRQAQLIAVTGWGQDLDKMRTGEAGFDRHLVKPADIDILEEILAACGEESQQV